MKKIFLGLMACAALCACTSDDLVSLGNETQKVFEGDVAYMTVRLQDVGANTRATSPTDAPFEYGTASEYAVSTADFYFYDSEGVFVSEADIWDGGTPSTHDDQTPDGNIEFTSNTVVVLKGLTQKNYPNYVVTVLNKPSDFKPGETLTEMASLLADAEDAIYTSVTSGSTPTNYFVMSTSSYDASASEAPAFSYFATPIPEDAFYEEPIADDLSELKNVVDIYVERLAAKATVDVSEGMTASTVTYTDEDGNSYSTYEIDETVAGDPNEETEPGEQDPSAGSGVAAEKIYVAFLGWTTNAIARNSYMMKNINTAWTNTGSGDNDLGTGWTWNDASNYRSYWGMSWNYGDENAEYPTTSNGNYPDDEAGTGTQDPLNKYLLYKNLQNPTALGTGYEYFGENTNTPDVLGSKYSSGITHVLLKAVVCDDKGNALDLVRYHGELFLEDAFLNYVLNELNYTGKLNIYTKSEGTGPDGADVYTQIDGSYVKLVTRSNGIVDIEVNEDAFDEETTYYSKDDDGNYSAITGGTSASGAEALLTAALTGEGGFCADDYYDANAYNGGLMYYSIPIEHLNNNYDDDNLAEANYGVVRNHWYRLTVTSVENLGKGIFDPDEVIVPNPKEEPLYYIGADINILSWKLVDQSVSL